MKKSDNIYNCLDSDLEIFEEKLISCFDDIKSKSLNSILDYVVGSHGKRFRPMLVYLFCKLFDTSNNTTHVSALLVELIHTSTLLHDDVIDESSLRRNKETVNKKWDDKTAILVGDYLFVHSMRLIINNNEYKLFDYISPVLLLMTSGEIDQMNNSKNFDINEKKYFDVISAKTASLVSISCELGVYSAKEKGQAYIKQAKDLGFILGIIFQIKDDVLDYVGDEILGKDIGADIKEGKITLPLIYAYNNMDVNTQEKIRNLWKLGAYDKNARDEIVNLVDSFSGIADCYNKMRELKKSVVDILDTFPDSEAKTALYHLLDYILERKK